MNVQQQLESMCARITLIGDTNQLRGFLKELQFRSVHSEYRGSTLPYAILSNINDPGHPLSAETDEKAAPKWVSRFFIIYGYYVEEG
jgi:hypothetical protein